MAWGHDRALWGPLSWAGACAAAPGTWHVEAAQCWGHKSPALPPSGALLGVSQGPRTLGSPTQGPAHCVQAGTWCAPTGAGQSLGYGGAVGGPRPQCRVLALSSSDRAVPCCRRGRGDGRPDAGYGAPERECGVTGDLGAGAGTWTFLQALWAGVPKLLPPWRGVGGARAWGWLGWAAAGSLLSHPLSLCRRRPRSAGSARRQVTRSWRAILHRTTEVLPPSLPRAL